MDEPSDKTTLTAFAIRRLRMKYVPLKRQLIEREGYIKELMLVNDEMGRRGEQMKGKVGVLEGETEAIKPTVTEAEEKAKNFSEEVEALEAQGIEKGKCIRQSILERDELTKEINDLEGRVHALEGDKQRTPSMASTAK